MRRHTKTWFGRAGAALLVALVIFVLGYVPYHLYARSGLARALQLGRELTALRLRNAGLRAENQRLAREAAALGEDLDAVERVARAELGWVRLGELIVDLAPEPAGAAPPAPAHALSFKEASR